MRVRDLRQGRRVVVKDDAPGNLSSRAGQRGGVFSFGGRIARVRFDGGGMLDIDARWLDPEPPEEEPVDSNELAVFKRRVAEVTRQYARDHNLCEVVDDFLNDLGVEKLPEQDMVITLRIPEDSFEYSSDADVSLEDVVADQLHDILDNAMSYQRLDYIKKVEFVDKGENV